MKNEKQKSLKTFEKPPNSSDHLVVKVVRATRFKADLAKQRRPEPSPRMVDLRSEVLTPEQLNEERLNEISDFFRYIFNNDWPQFVVCPDCDSTVPGGMQISAKDVFGSDTHVPLDVMDKTHNGDLPNCPCCDKKTRIFHDPAKTHKNISEKLGKDGHVSLLRTSDENKLAGFMFGYGCTLEECFNYELRNRYHYMAEEDPRFDRSLEKLIDALHKVTQKRFTPRTNVFCWNCIATAPEARRQKMSTMRMAYEFFGALPPEKLELSVVGEVQAKSEAHRLFKFLGGVDVPGFFDDGEIIITGKLGTGAERIKRFG